MMRGGREMGRQVEGDKSTIDRGRGHIYGMENIRTEYILSIMDTILSPSSAGIGFTGREEEEEEEEEGAVEDGIDSRSRRRHRKEVWGILRTCRQQRGSGVRDGDRVR
jgi:hypothetical protein